MFLLYLLEQDRERRDIAAGLLQEGHFISTQVVAENINICLKKLKMSKENAFRHGALLLEAFQVLQITEHTLRLAFEISSRYQLSFWDSLIVATALENNCNMLFSEDMQDGFIIENQLKIVNPFKAK